MFNHITGHEANEHRQHSSTAIDDSQTLEECLGISYPRTEDKSSVSSPPNCKDAGNHTQKHSKLSSFYKDRETENLEKHRAGVILTKLREARESTAARLKTSNDAAQKQMRQLGKEIVDIFIGLRRSSATNKKDVSVVVSSEVIGGACGSKEITVTLDVGEPAGDDAGNKGRVQSPWDILLSNYKHNEPAQGSLSTKVYGALYSDRFTNCLVRAGDQRFNCHLFILGFWTDYFKNNLVNGEIKLPREHVTPVAFSVVRDWMYLRMTGNVQSSLQLLTEENVLQVYVAARHLQLAELQNECWAFLQSAEKFTYRGALQVYRMASDRCLLSVMTAVVPTLGWNFSNIVRSNYFLAFTGEGAILLLGSDYVLVESEMEVLGAALAWLSYKSDERQSFVSRVVACVRFGLMSKSELLSIQIQSGIAARPGYRDVIATQEVQEMVRIGLGCALAKSQFQHNREEYRREMKKHALPEPAPRHAMKHLEDQAAICIQSAYRGHMIRKELKRRHAAAAKIQTAFRTYTTRRKFLQIIQMQKAYQVFIASQEAEQKNQAAIIIQAAFRGYMARTMCTKKWKAVQLLQTVCKLLSYRNRVKRRQEAARTIQRSYARYRALQEILWALLCPGSLYDKDVETCLVLGGTDLSLPPDEMMMTGKEIYSYNRLRNIWDVVGHLPEPRYLHGVVFLSGKIYVVGGKDPRILKTTRGSFRVVASTWSLEPATNIWKREGDLRTARCSHGLVVLGGKMYAVGGENAHGDFIASAECFDPSTGRWSTVAPMLGRRTAVAACAYGGRLWVAGGVTGGRKRRLLRTVECYNPTTDVWTPSSPLRYKLCYGEMVNMKSRLMIAGGAGCPTSFDRPASVISVDAWSPGTSSWRLHHEMDAPRHGHAVTLLEGQMLILGGQSTFLKNTVTLHGVECHFNQYKAWMTQIAPLPVPLSAHRAITLPSAAQIADRELKMAASQA